MRSRYGNQSTVPRQCFDVSMQKVRLCRSAPESQSRALGPFTCSVVPAQSPKYHFALGPATDVAGPNYMCPISRGHCRSRSPGSPSSARATYIRRSTSPVGLSHNSFPAYQKWAFGYLFTVTRQPLQWLPNTQKQHLLAQPVGAGVD